MMWPIDNVFLQAQETLFMYLVDSAFKRSLNIVDEISLDLACMAGFQRTLGFIIYVVYS